MREAHYTTTNGQRDGRASKFFGSTTAALLKAKAQNEKAEAMGLVTRYEVATCPEADLPEKERLKS